MRRQNRPRTKKKLRGGARRRAWFGAALILLLPIGIWLALLSSLYQSVDQSAHRAGLAAGLAAAGLVALAHALRAPSAPRGRWPPLALFIAVTTWAYTTWGLTVYNAAHYASPEVSRFETTVVAKGINHTMEARYWWLELSPWVKGGATSKRLTVSEASYDRAAIGDPLTLELARGRLGWLWIVSARHEGGALDI